MNAVIANQENTVSGFEIPLLAERTIEKWAPVFADG
jgi:hypothetical protein